MSVISKISCSLFDTHQEFSFIKPFASNEKGVACLQLPDTADSIHSIDGVEQCDWNDQDREIFQQLKDFFFASYDDVECAAASALLGRHIWKLIEVDGYYVAFPMARVNYRDLFLIKESPLRSYYNKAALFVSVDEHELDDDLCVSDFFDKALEIERVNTFTVWDKRNNEPVPEGDFDSAQKAIEGMQSLMRECAWTHLSVVDCDGNLIAESSDYQDEDSGELRG